jgi:hypothetical protein
MNKKEKKITASEKGSQKKHGYINTAQALEKRGGGAVYEKVARESAGWQKS